MKSPDITKPLLAAIVALFMPIRPAEASETFVLSAGAMHKFSDHVAFGIRAFGLNYLSFENPSEKNGNNIEGFQRVSVWDRGKLTTISVSDEEWQETLARTAHGCVAGRRLARARFTFDVKAQAQPGKTSKAIEGTDVKLVSVKYYEE